MVWIIGIAIGVIILGVIGYGLEKENTEFNELAKSRAEAYLLKRI